MTNFYREYGIAICHFKNWQICQIHLPVFKFARFQSETYHITKWLQSLLEPSHIFGCSQVTSCPSRTVFRSVPPYLSPVFRSIVTVCSSRPYFTHQFTCLVSSERVSCLHTDIFLFRHFSRVISTASYP